MLVSNSSLATARYPLSPRERLVQDRVIRLLRDQLGYEYLGNWGDRPDNRNVELALAGAPRSRQGNKQIARRTNCSRPPRGGHHR